MTPDKLNPLIAPSFASLHRQMLNGGFSHYWLKGGRGSAKSSFISLEIVLGVMRDPEANAVVLRKVGNTLRDSVYEQMVWAVEKLKVGDLWEQKKTPLCLIFKPTGQKILFRGGDNPHKIKSVKVSKGYVRFIWYEEVDEFRGMEELRVINQSLMRGGKKFDVFYSYNPPKNVGHWVNGEVAAQSLRADTIVHHSDFRWVPLDWLGEQFVAEAEELRRSRPEFYRHEYLGEVTGTGGEVFKNVVLREISDGEIASFDRVRRGLDWGYGPDPFVYLALHFDKKRGKVYLFYEFYRFRARYDEIAAAILSENKLCEPVTAESAEPRSNDELRERGVRILAAKKGPGSVEHGVSWFQNLQEIVIDPQRCPNAAREFSQYELERDPVGGFKSGFPDRDNHCIDASRYACEREMKRGGTSFS